MLSETNIVRIFTDKIKKQSLPINNYHQSLKIAARQPTKRLVDFGYSLFYT